jgi:hypothetical protein
MTLIVKRWLFDAIQCIISDDYIEDICYFKFIVRSEYISPSEYQKVYFTSGAATGEIWTFGAHEVKYISILHKTKQIFFSLYTKKRLKVILT